MGSSLDAELLGGGVGGVYDVVRVQGGVVRLGRGRGVVHLVVGVVVLRGVVSPANGEFGLLELGLRAIARAARVVDCVGDVGGRGTERLRDSGVPIPGCVTSCSSSQSFNQKFNRLLCIESGVPTPRVCD